MENLPLCKCGGDWKMSILEDFRTWLWIMKNNYNPHMSEYFFNCVGSNLPEQTFIKAEDT
jgi:hypothetical protein